MSIPSSIHDNRPPRGSSGDFLRSAVTNDTALSFVSAYFTAPKS